MDVRRRRTRPGNADLVLALDGHQTSLALSLTLTRRPAAEASQARTGPERAARCDSRCFPADSRSVLTGPLVLTVNHDPDHVQL